ncbi:MAG TPA: hypothetical protein VJK25_03545 [Patescibacteria group bacterium]|nr:hypothetical protein [Patescibacteria group bacterium]
MMTEYKSKMKRLWQISLAESFKVYVLAIAGWVVLFLLSQFLHSLGLDVLQGLLKLVYLILIVLLIFFALRPMAKTFFKAGFSPAVWMLLFMIINLTVIGLVIIWLSLIFTDFGNITDLIKGPFNVIIYLG